MQLKLSASKRQSSDSIISGKSTGRESSRSQQHNINKLEMCIFMKQVELQNLHKRLTGVDKEADKIIQFIDKKI